MNEEYSEHETIARDTLTNIDSDILLSDKSNISNQVEEHPNSDNNTYFSNDSSIDEELYQDSMVLKKGLFRLIQDLFVTNLTGRKIFILLEVALFAWLSIFWNQKYKGLVVDTEKLQDKIVDISNRSIFVSSQLVEYKRQERIENEIIRKNLNIHTSEIAPYIIDDAKQ